MPEAADAVKPDELIDLVMALGPVQAEASRSEPPRLVFATGRLALSPSAIAWTTSIFIHAAVISAGLWIAITLVHHARLPADWGGGGGSSGGLVAEQPQSQIIAEALPGSASIPVERANRPPVDQSAEAFRLPAKGGTAFGTNSFAPSEAVRFGVSNSSPDVLPRTGRGGGRPSARQHAAGSAQNDSGPGLPGAVLRKGLPTPDYPAESKRLGEQGTVRVAIEVLPSGHLGDVRVLSDPGYARLRDAALDAARKLQAFTFTPATRGGKLVSEVIVIPYVFKLH